MGKKNKGIYIKVTEEEREAIKAKVGNLMPVSTYMRGLALGEKITPIDKNLEKARIVSLARIGNNINQVAHRINTDNLSGKLTNEVYIEVAEQLADISKEIKESFKKY